MLLNIICFKNKLINAATTPTYVDIDAEKCAVQLGRSIMLDKDGTTSKTYTGLVMYKIGEFDDVAMTITPCTPVQLLDCDEVLAQRKVEKEDGNDNQTKSN